jgi:hypothetical protein
MTEVLSAPQEPQSPPPAEPAAPAAMAARRFTFRYRYVLLDAALRWGVLAALRFGFINTVFFWILQVVVSLVGTSWTGNRAVKIRDEYGLIAGETDKDMGPFASTMVVAFMVLGVYFSWVMPSTSMIWLNRLIGIGLTLIWISFLTAIVVNSIGDPIESDEAPGGVDIDANDRAIIRLENDRASFVQRLETYTLESTLLGAIAFSAFVSIAASDRDAREGVTAMISIMRSAGMLLGKVRIIPALELLGTLRDEKALLAAIAVESLVCSIAFLCVLIARIRFADLLSWADYSIRVATAMNDKEEELNNLSFGAGPDQKSQIEQRLLKVRSEIDKAVEHAISTLSRVRPLLVYLLVFRNAGMLAFVFMLITSALWLSHTLALLFLIVSVVAGIYPALDRIRDRALERLQFFRTAISFRRR